MNELTQALQSNEQATQTVIDSNSLQVTTRKGLTRYESKIIGLSLVYNRKRYKHLASTDKSDMFIEVSITCKRNKDVQGIATVSPTNEVVYVDTLTVNDPILYTVVFHTYSTGKMLTQAGVIAGNGYTKVSLTVKRDNNTMTVGTIKKDRFTSDIDDLSVAQLTLIQSLETSLIAKHSEIETGKHYNQLMNGGQFESKADVFNKPSNKHYLENARIQLEIRNARKQAKQLNS